MKDENDETIAIVQSTQLAGDKVPERRFDVGLLSESREDDDIQKKCTDRHPLASLVSRKGPVPPRPNVFSI